jgi:hypothetical protein
MRSSQLGLVWKGEEGRRKQTVNVKSANPVLVSPPLLIAATLTSAKNSGKLLKHTALNAARPSFSSSPVPTFPPVPELVMVVELESPLRLFKTSSHLPCSRPSDSNAASARNVYLWRERLMREVREVRVLVRRVRSGVKRVVYVWERVWEVGRGERDVQRVHSSWVI